MPEVSRGFHFWQPANKLNQPPPPLMAGTTAQPIHEPPQKRENKQVTFTLKNISGKGGGGMAKRNPTG